MRDNPDCPISQTGETWMRDGRRVNPGRRHRKRPGDIFIDSLRTCLISPSAAILRRELLDEVGGFDEDMAACEDYDLWLRILARHEAGLLDEPLAVRRAGHPGTALGDRRGARSLPYPRAGEAARRRLARRRQAHGGGGGDGREMSHLWQGAGAPRPPRRRRFLRRGRAIGAASDGPTRLTRRLRPRACGCARCSAATTHRQSQSSQGRTRLRSYMNPKRSFRCKDCRVPVLRACWTIVIDSSPPYCLCLGVVLISVANLCTGIIEAYKAGYQ